jgi:NADPH:quinone reductase-like Zn-dependent oxidoreductase
MRAWILDESPGAYRWGSIEPPEPGPDEVRVRVVTSALNHMDLWVSRGLPRPPVPHIPGADGAGVIERLGANVSGLRVGDEVVLNPAISCRRCPVCLAGDSPLCPDFHILGEHGWGAHAELVVLPAANVVPKPAGRTWEECAAYPLCTLTAWRMLRRARLHAGETLLVVGVGGGVSSAGVVLGRAVGARVFATSRDPDKRRRAIELGAEDAFDSAVDFPVRAEVVFENVGAATWERSVKALAPGGRLVTCGGTAGTTVPLSLPRLFFKQHEIIGSTMGSYAEFAEVAALVERGLPVVVDTIYPLEDFPAALAALEEGSQMGKLVLRHPE